MIILPSQAWDKLTKRDGFLAAGTFPFYCPNTSAALELGDLPPAKNFTTPGHQPQWAWAEGNQYKLFGCVGRDTRVRKNTFCGAVSKYTSKRAIF